jgi:hypothetical protein
VRDSKEAWAGEGAQTVQDHLLDPIVLRAVQLVRQGDEYQQDATSLNLKWSPSTPGRITGWLKSGASMAALAQLISEKPALIGHPVVYHQISRLLWLPGIPDEGDDFCLPNVDYRPPAGTRQAAHDSLRTLVEAWVHGVLGKGWTLRPPKKRRGRKRTLEDISWDSDLLSIYEDLIGLLRQHAVRRAVGESKGHWRERLSHIIEIVWLECDLSYVVESGEIPPGGTVLDLPIIRTPVFIPPERISEWVAETADKSAEGPIRDRLAYLMIGHRFNLSPDQVRGRIQTARKENK